MSSLLENPIFWRGVHGTLQVFGLILCGLIGLYLVLRRSRTTSTISMRSPILRLLFTGHSVGIVLVVISGVGLAIGLLSGEARRTSDGKSDVLHYSGSRKAEDLTAKEWYFRVADEQKFGGRPLSPERKSELIEMTAKLRPELSHNEIAEFVSNYDPRRHLEPLLDDVMRNLPYKYERKISDVYAGELPSNALDAAVITTPGGGHMILLPAGTSHNLHQWAKPICAYIIQKTREDRSGVIEKIKRSFIAYNTHDTTPDFSEYNDPDVVHTASIITSAAIEFLIAHEIAHIGLGHTKANTYSTEQEEEADIAAIEIVLHNLPDHADETAVKKGRLIMDKQIGYCGILYATSCLLFAEHEPRTQRMTLRFAKILTKIGHGEDMEKFSFYLNFSNMVRLTYEGLNTTVPPPDELDAESRYLGRIYIAYKAGDEKELSSIVNETPDDILYRKYITMLVEGALALARNRIADTSTDWSRGDFLNPAGLYRLACSMHAARIHYLGKTKIAEKSEWLNRCGGEIIMHLRNSIEFFQNRNDFPSRNAVRDMEGQIKQIENAMKPLKNEVPTNH